MRRFLPILEWGPRYDRRDAVERPRRGGDRDDHADPAIAGLCDARRPAARGGALRLDRCRSSLYALFGTSRTLAVGPVAVVSLMTASAVGELAVQGTPEYLAAAMLLALLSGVMLILMGLFRLGFVANFLSHPVISGFITASGLLIAAGQLKHILGISAGGHTLPEIVTDLVVNIGQTNLVTPRHRPPVLALPLFWCGQAEVAGWWLRARPALADVTTKAGPSRRWPRPSSHRAARSRTAGVALVGAIPQGLPVPGVPAFDARAHPPARGPGPADQPIGFVESVSVAQTLASKRRQRILPDQELIGLGAANVASAISSRLSR